MSTSGIYYLNAPSLSSATSAYTDAALTIVASDGWYSDGTTVRELVSGVFTNVISSCAPCASPCSTTPIAFVGDLAFLEMNQSTGTTSSDVGAVVIEVNFNGNARPLGIYFEQNGVVYNSLSCQNYGRVQGPAGPNQVVYIGNVTFDCGILAAGFLPLPKCEYNPVTSAFEATGEYLSAKALSPQIDLSAGVPGKFVAVIPKLTPDPSNIYTQCRLLCSLNDFNITIKCPQRLPSFTSTGVNAASVDACGAGTVNEYYSADVNGGVSLGGFLGLYDWVFADYNGETVLADGFYRSPSVPSPNTFFEVQDGVVVSFGACGAVPLWTITYEDENAIAGACAANVSDLRLTVSQPPVTPYIDVSAPATGTSNVPEGLTHVTLRMYWFEAIPACGQVKMVIEKNGVVIAYKTITPTSGVYEYLDVDFILEDDASIYGYVTLV
jgi:hypothetical protein